ARGRGAWGERAWHSAIAAWAVLAWALSAWARDGAGWSLGILIRPRAARARRCLHIVPRVSWSGQVHPGRPDFGAATVYDWAGWVSWTFSRQVPRKPGCAPRGMTA